MYKTNNIGLLSVLFYVVLFFNQYVTIEFGADYIAHAGVVIILWLSYRERCRFKEKKIWIISSWIFSLKFIGIVSQICFLFYELESVLYYSVMAICIFLTLVAEIAVYFCDGTKDIKKYEKERVFNYIDEYFMDKYEKDIMIGFAEDNSEDQKMKLAALSGIHNMVLVMSVIAIYVMKLINKNMRLPMQGILLVLVLLLIDIVNWYVLQMIMKNKRTLSVCAILGISLLYIFEVVFYKEMDIWRMLVWAGVGLLILPIVAEKVKIAIGLKENSK